MATECRKCGKNPAKDSNCLRRVNPIGELPAVWECSPNCEAQSTMSSAELILHAIEAEDQSED